MSTDRFAEVRRRHANAEAGGGAERMQRQHKEGKLSARERIDLLLDEGTFEEMDKLVRHRCRDFGMDTTVIDGDGFVTGYGQITAIMGPCAGGAVYSPALTDFILMVDRTSHMFVTGPDVIKTVTHEEVSKEELGGAETHNSKSGVAHFIAPDDRECLRMIRGLLAYLPQNNREDPPLRKTVDPDDRADAEIDSIVPRESNLPYDVKDVIHRVVDDGEFFEVHEHYARNIVVGFAH